MLISIGSDHAGYEKRKRLVKFLSGAGYDVIDFGCFSKESCDYPDYARLVAGSVSRGRTSCGVLICGTGIGMGIAANKVRGVRAAVAWDLKTALMAKAHNNANVLCLPARSVKASQMEKMVKKWITSGFEGGRHNRRLRKIKEIERSSL